MSNSIKNLYEFQTTSKILQSDWASDTFTVSNDVLTKSAVALTNARVLAENLNWSRKELFQIDVSGGTATIDKRWIKPDGTTDTTLQYERPKWTTMKVVVLEWQLMDKSDDNTITDWKKVYFWANAYVTTDNDGTDLKLKDGNNSETTLSTLTAASWSDEKVKISSNDTTSDFLINKITGGDGISVSEVTDWGNEDLDIDIDTTDTSVFVTSASTSKIPKTDATNGYLREFINSNADWLATETEPWLMPERASDAETLAWTANKFPDASQIKDNYETVVFTTSFERLTSASSWSQTIAHGLSRTPKIVRFSYYFDGDVNSSRGLFTGVYDGTNNRAIGMEDGWSSSDVIRTDSYCIHIVNSSWQGWQATAAVDGTNITLTWTKNSTPPSNLHVLVEAIA